MRPGVCMECGTEYCRATEKHDAVDCLNQLKKAQVLKAQVLKAQVLVDALKKMREFNCGCADIPPRVIADKALEEWEGK